MTVDISGKRFNRLFVIQRHSNPSSWECRCDCGETIRTSLYSLRSGHTKSCGCLRFETLKSVNLMHGMTGTKTHNIWKDMIRRCDDRKRKTFKHYGGRGIKICRRWHKFTNFFADMGECPPGYSIERKEVNGDYTPGNCLWIPANKQGRNRRLTIRINGVPLAELCERKGLRYGLVYDRIKRLGWSPKEALRT